MSRVKAETSGFLDSSGAYAQNNGSFVPLFEVVDFFLDLASMTTTPPVLLPRANELAYQVYLAIDDDDYDDTNQLPCKWSSVRENMTLPLEGREKERRFLDKTGHQDKAPHGAAASFINCQEPGYGKSSQTATAILSNVILGLKPEARGWLAGASDKDVKHSRRYAYLKSSTQLDAALLHLNQSSFRGKSFHVVPFFFNSRAHLASFRRGFCQTLQDRVTDVGFCHPYVSLGLYLFIDGVKIGKQVKASKEYPEQKGMACSFAVGSWYVPHLQHSNKLMYPFGIIIGGDDKENVVQSMKSVNGFGQLDFFNNHPLTARGTTQDGDTYGFIMASFAMNGDSMFVQYVNGRPGPMSPLFNPNSIMTARAMRSPARQLFNTNFEPVMKTVSFHRSVVSGVGIDLISAISHLKGLLKRVRMLMEPLQLVQMVHEEMTSTGVAMINQTEVFAADYSPVQTVRQMCGRLSTISETLYLCCDKSNDAVDKRKKPYGYELGSLNSWRVNGPLSYTTSVVCGTQSAEEKVIHSALCDSLYPSVKGAFEGIEGSLCDNYQTRGNEAVDSGEELRLVDALNSMLDMEHGNMIFARKSVLGMPTINTPYDAHPEIEGHFGYARIKSLLVQIEELYQQTGHLNISHELDSKNVILQRLNDWTAIRDPINLIFLRNLTDIHPMNARMASYELCGKSKGKQKAGGAAAAAAAAVASFTLSNFPAPDDVFKDYAGPTGSNGQRGLPYLSMFGYRAGVPPAADELHSVLCAFGKTFFDRILALYAIAEKLKKKSQHARANPGIPPAPTPRPKKATRMPKVKKTQAPSLSLPPKPTRLGRHKKASPTEPPVPENVFEETMPARMVPRRPTAPPKDLRQRRLFLRDVNFDQFLRDVSFYELDEPDPVSLSALRRVIAAPGVALEVKSVLHGNKLYIKGLKADSVPSVHERTSSGGGSTIGQPYTLLLRCMRDLITFLIAVFRSTDVLLEFTNNTMSYNVFRKEHLVPSVVLLQRLFNTVFPCVPRIGGGGSNAFAMDMWTRKTNDVFQEQLFSAMRRHNSTGDQSCRAGEQLQTEIKTACHWHSMRGGGGPQQQASAYTAQALRALLQTRIPPLANQNYYSSLAAKALKSFEEKKQPASQMLFRRANTTKVWLERAFCWGRIMGLESTRSVDGDRFTYALNLSYIEGVADYPSCHQHGASPPEWPAGITTKDLKLLHKYFVLYGSASIQKQWNSVWRATGHILPMGTLDPCTGKEVTQDEHFSVTRFARELV